MKNKVRSIWLLPLIAWVINGIVKVVSCAQGQPSPNWFNWWGIYICLILTYIVILFDDNHNNFAT